MRWLTLAALVALAVARLPGVGEAEETEIRHGTDLEDLWRTAEKRGQIYADCAVCARRLLQGWIDEKRDLETNLFSRDGAWDYHDEAADHYSSLVWMAHHVQPDLLQENGVLHRTLANSQELCTTRSGLPAVFDLRKRARNGVATYGSLSEWLKDGLIRIVEIRGTDNDWYAEMERLVDAIMTTTAEKGPITNALTGVETQGNMLQSLARLHAMSGEEDYLLAAEKIADHALPQLLDQIDSVRFQDHGGELVPGLAELFVLESKLKRSWAERNRARLQRLLDHILAEFAHPESGLFCQRKLNDDGQRVWQQPTDTWGYTLFAYENFDLATGESRYRAAIEKPVRWLITHRDRYAELKGTLWPRAQSSDDWSDSYESMIVLASRLPEIEGVFEWLDWATRQHIHRRRVHPLYGPFTGGHFDGSVGRTLCLHMMLCSQGVRSLPMMEDLRVGGIVRGGRLHLHVSADRPWRGRLYFDGPRNEHSAAAVDWTRINEMPQWFVVRPETLYQVTLDDEAAATVVGNRLLKGYPIEVIPEHPHHIVIDQTGEHE